MHHNIIFTQTIPPLIEVYLHSLCVFGLIPIEIHSLPFLTIKTQFRSI